MLVLTIQSGMPSLGDALERRLDWIVLFIGLTASLRGWDRVSPNDFVFAEGRATPTSYRARNAMRAFSGLRRLADFEYFGVVH